MTVTAAGDRQLWKILLVEDDEDDYVLTRSLLDDVIHGQYEMVWAPTYDQALNACTRDIYDVHLIDYRLGKRDGLALVREMMQRGCKTPVILLTGQGSYDVDLEAMKAGVTDYLVKGEVTAPLLERTIRYAIERKQAEEALRRAHDELEMRVKERTEALHEANQQLEQANAELREEISERLRAEEALTASEARFRNLAETTSSAIFIVEGQQIRYANPAARSITGFTPEELLGMEFYEIAHPTYQDIIRTGGVAPQIADHIPARYELKLRTKAGKDRWADVTAGKLAYEGRQAYILTAFDITERDLAEQALRSAKSELEARVAERTAELQEANRRLAESNQKLQDQLGERQRASEEREALIAENKQLREFLERLKQP
jgi:PAS domain S-box-containing protein